VKFRPTDRDHEPLEWAVGKGAEPLPTIVGAPPLIDRRVTTTGRSWRPSRN